MGYINQASESVLQAGCSPEDTFKTQIQTRKGDKFSGKMALSKNVGPRHPKTWLVVWNMVFIFHSVGNVIIPTDFHSYFSEGLVNHQPENC